jgi:bifunctional ADP-heptose synthase (sugar kinase/adenylyltransferase)
MSGGTAFYFSHSIKYFNDIDYFLFTAVEESELKAVKGLRDEGLNVSVIPSKYSVYFENIYEINQDHRKQRVLSKAEPFTIESLKELKSKIIHLGALLADDFSSDVIKFLSEKSLLSVDSQGFLREVRNNNVFAIDWAGKENILRYIYFLKANEDEMKMLTGFTEIIPAAKQLYEWGVKEVVITLGGSGSVIFDGKMYYKIPAYKPSEVIDATGCGDTYMAGYLYQRFKGIGIEEAGRFAAAMATLKIQHTGPFNGTKSDIINCINNYQQYIPEI